jgi:hypothetical protein
MVMKYWNKDKKIRERCWHRVTVDRFKLITYSWQDIKHMLQLDPSTGKFFMNFEYARIEFEFEKDAAWFLLRWS